MSSEIGIRFSFRNVSFCRTRRDLYRRNYSAWILLDVLPRKDTYSRSKCKFVQAGYRIPWARTPVVAPDATGEIIIRPMCNSRTYHDSGIHNLLYNFVSRNRRNRTDGDEYFDGVRNKWIQVIVS